MSSANGMCRHNNQENYCPTCTTEESRKRFYTMSGGNSMGATCPAGFYDMFGICVPNLSTVTKGVQAGVVSSVATGATQSAAVKQAGLEAAGNTLGQKIVKFYADSPVLAWGATAAVVGFVIYGAMSFVRGK